MKTNFLLAIACLLIAACNSGTTETIEQPTTMPTEQKQQPAEFADAKYADIGRKALADMTSGDVDAWAGMFADNAKYFWNSGDSLIGKAAITGYWKKRRSEVIDSITFRYDIWLPVKVNVSEQPQQTPGVWLLSWYMVTAKYKNGKSVSQWVHNDFHFDTNDKIDQAIQYLDRAPINAALAK